MTHQLTSLLSGLGLNVTTRTQTFTVCFCFQGLLTSHSPPPWSFPVCSLTFIGNMKRPGTDYFIKARSSSCRNFRQNAKLGERLPVQSPTCSTCLNPWCQFMDWHLHSASGMTRVSGEVNYVSSERYHKASKSSTTLLPGGFKETIIRVKSLV